MKNLYESIKENLEESEDLYDFANKTTANDFIADGTYSFSQKIMFIAEQLEESGHVDSYEDPEYNDYLLEVANILKKAAQEIDNLK